MNLHPSALPSIFSVPTAMIQLASTTHASDTCSREESPASREAGHCSESRELCDSLSFSEQSLWLYCPRTTFLVSQKTASILFCWPSRRAESFSCSWLITLHVTGHDGEGICFALWEAIEFHLLYYRVLLNKVADLRVAVLAIFREDDKLPSYT